MAWWGLAMNAAENPFVWPVGMKLIEGAEAIQKAQQVGATTARQREYIAALELLYRDHASTPHRQRALAYEEAMGKLAARYPDDVEARILYALTVSGNHDLNDKTFARPLKAAGLLEPLFVSLPHHPGVAHYLIHSYDYPPIAPKGLPAAQRYARWRRRRRTHSTCPRTSSRAWAPGVTRSPPTSAACRPPRAIRAIPRTAWTTWSPPTCSSPRTRAPPASSRSPPLPSAPKRAKAGFAEAFGLAAMPSRLALEHGRWAEAGKLELPANLSEVDWKRYPQAESVQAFARAIGAARSGDAVGARREIERLGHLQRALAERKLGYWAAQSEVQAKVATAWALRAEGKDAEAIAALRAAADHEDRTEKHAVTPGPILPARELLGDVLLELNRPAEAVVQYEASIAKEPNRLRGVFGAARAAELAGDRDKARKHYGHLIQQVGGGATDRPELRQAKAFMGTR